MLFAQILTLQLKITSFVIEFCKINTLISLHCNHFQGTYICKLTHHQNIATYIYTLTFTVKVSILVLVFWWNLHLFNGSFVFYNILLALRQSDCIMVAEWVEISYQWWKRNSMCHVIANFGLVRCKAEINLLYSYYVTPF